MATKKNPKTNRPTLNPALRDFWTTPARNRVLYGGRVSSKSWDAAGFAIFLAQNYRVKVLCTRQFQNRISDSVYTLLKIQIERFGLENEFIITKSKIVHRGTGSEFLFYGLFRHIGEIKSLEGVDICWVEEAQGLTETQWDILEPTLRGDSSQFWIIFNPDLVTDFVYQKFITNPPKNTIVRKINYTENPFLSDTILAVIEAKKAEDVDAYNHIYLGEPRQDDDSAIIKRSWIRAAIDAHKVLNITPSGRWRVGFDVADGGNDSCATASVHGILCYAIDEWSASDDELLKSATRVYAQAKIHNSEIIYDSIGIGAFAGAHFKAMNEDSGADVKYFKFNASGEVMNKYDHIDPHDDNSPTNGDFFCNIKAQAWLGIARRFRNTYNAVERGMDFPEEELISISSDIDDLDGLIDELSEPKRDFDARGKFKVESKKDLARRDIRSPNRTDAMIMAYAEMPNDAPFVWTVGGKAIAG